MSYSITTMSKVFTTAELLTVQNVLGHFICDY